MRSGTVPHTLAVGLGAACEIALQERQVGVSWWVYHGDLVPFLQYDSVHISKLSQKLVDGITSQLDHVIRNGDPEHTYNGTHSHAVVLHHVMFHMEVCTLRVCT